MSENTLHRIKKYIDSKDISIRAFEQTVGMSNGSFASQLKHNKTIGVDKLENILRVYTDINPEWLLTGRGEMIKNNSYVNQKDNNQLLFDPNNPAMMLLLNRIEKLAVENAKLKDENESIRKQKKSYDLIVPDIAAEPELKPSKPEKNK